MNPHDQLACYVSSIFWAPHLWCIPATSAMLRVSGFQFFDLGIAPWVATEQHQTLTSKMVHKILMCVGVGFGVCVCVPLQIRYQLESDSTCCESWLKPFRWFQGTPRVNTDVHHRNWWITPSLSFRLKGYYKSLVWINWRNHDNSPQPDWKECWRHVFEKTLY